MAIIGIIAAMLLPALSRSKERTRAIACMNHTKQLLLAWTMYAGDYNDRLVYNIGGTNFNNWGYQSYAPTNLPNWVNNTMDWTTSPDNTNVAFVGISLLGPYVNYSAPIFHCPSDHAVSDVQAALGWTSRVRSYSMNAMVGDPGALLQGGVNINNPNLRQFLKQSDIPDPSAIFVFLDEHPESLGDGYYINPISQDEWQRLPGSYHNNGGSFAFADGHTEIHPWVDPGTIAAPMENPDLVPNTPRSDQLSDFNWVAARTSIPQ